MIYKCLTCGFGAAFGASLILLWMRGILLRESENELARTRSALDWWRNRFEEQRTSERVPTRYECYWRDIAFKWRDRCFQASRERDAIANKIKTQNEERVVDIAYRGPG